MNVIYCRIGQAPEILTIDGTLESMQKLVGGYIETYPYEYAPMTFGKNEDGDDDIVGLTKEQEELVFATIGAGRLC